MKLTNKSDKTDKKRWIAISFGMQYSEGKYSREKQIILKQSKERP